MSDGPIMAVMDLWVVKVMAPILTFVGGIWISRANIMNAVTKRVESLLDRLEGEIKRLTEAHAHCEEHLADHKARIEQLEGELRQEKQIGMSAVRQKGNP